MTKFVIIIATIVLLFNLSGCARESETFVIGVSQCSEDLWRETVNREIKRSLFSKQYGGDHQVC